MHTSKKIILLLVLILLSFSSSPFTVKPAEAATGLNFIAIRPDRMAISLTTDYLVIVKPTTALANKIVISFPAGFNVSGAAATVTGVPTSYHNQTVVNFLNLGTATVSSQDVTIPTTSGTLSTSTYYGVYVTGIVNPGTVGEKVFPTIVTKTSGGTVLDTSSLVVYIVDDNGGSTDSDQIVVTASVSPTFSLILGSNSDSVTTSLGSVASGSGVNATVITNSQSGYSVWLKSGTGAGLTSATTGTSIPFFGTVNGAAQNLTPGTGGVVIDVNTVSNTSTNLLLDPEYDGGASGGGTPSTTYAQIFSSTLPVGGVGDVASIVPKVAISATTKAATDYVQTFTVTGAGSF